MLFNSFNFIIFFFCVLLLLIIEQYTTKRVAARNALLLIASYIFYGWFNIGFLFILLYVTLVNYTTGKILSKATLHRKAFFNQLAFCVKRVDCSFCETLRNTADIRLKRCILFPSRLSLSCLCLTNQTYNQPFLIKRGPA